MSTFTLSQTAAALFTGTASAEKARSGSRVTIVGCGAVGLAAAYSLLNQGSAAELVLIDVRAQLSPWRGASAQLSGGQASSSMWIFAIKCESSRRISQASYMARRDGYR